MSGLWSRWVKPEYDIFNWDYWFGQVDARPLGIFRILFALLLLKTAIYHLLLGEMFYSDSGIAPRHLMPDIYRQWRWSLMDYFGADWQVNLFILIWIIVLVALLLGYQTRLMTIFNWLLILSLHERNTYYLNGADTAMRVISFWIMFLPLGRAYALDRLRQPSLPLTSFAFPLRIIQLQFAFIYLSTFIMKAHGSMWLDGSAVYHALQLRSFTHPIADWVLVNVPYIVFQIGTLFTLVAEGAFFLLMFLPFEQPRLKRVGLVAMASVHLGIGVLMAVPNFSMVMLVCYVLFFEGKWVVALGQRIAPKHTFLDIPTVSSALAINRRRIMLIAVMSFLLFQVFAYNLWFMRPNDTPLGSPLSDTQVKLVEWLGLWQNWSMFAPNPSPTDGGLLMMGLLENGQRIELRTGLYRDNELPRFYFGLGTRWKKYDENLYFFWLTDLMEAHARYLCRHHPSQNVQHIEIIYRFRQTVDYGEPFNPYRDQPIWTISCEAGAP
jgi:hypothetical protein